MILGVHLLHFCLFDIYSPLAHRGLGHSLLPCLFVVSYPRSEGRHNIYDMMRDMPGAWRTGEDTVIPPYRVASSDYDYVRISSTYSASSSKQ